jgi:hypothetical protein
MPLREMVGDNHQFPSPLTFPFTPRDCVIMGKSSRDSKKRDRQTGEKALDLPARSPALRDEGRAQP